MIQFRGNIYRHEYDLMYFSGNKWLDRKTRTTGIIKDYVSKTIGRFYDSELILNIIK
jgi:hypothetical protein